MLRPCISCLLLFFTGTSTTFADTDREPVGLDAFQQRFAEVLEANDIPGAGIVLVRGGNVEWAGGIGYADYSEGRHVLGTTRFRIGSVTKMFTALAILQLVEEGRLALDQPVRELAPEVPIDNPWSRTDPVRIAHLLEHSAGFDDMHFRNMNTDAPIPDSLEAIVRGLEHELRVRWQPGVKHSYSNPGYAVAGYLVEKVSGRPFHEYLQEKVLVPLRMSNAGWGTPADLAQGYVRDGHDVRPIAPRAIHLYPAGELSVSAVEMAALVQLLLRRGELDGERIVDAESIERMETPTTTRAARHGLENGYGLGNYVSFRNGFRLHGHNGGLDGFMAELAYSPEHEFGYVVMINRADPAALRVLSELAVEFLAADIAPPEPGEHDRAAAGVPADIAGCYRMTNPRNELLHGMEWLLQVACVQVEDDHAVLRHPVLPQVTMLAPVQDALLRENNSAWPTAVFLQDSGQEDALEWSWIYFERSSWPAVTGPWIVAIVSIVLMVSTLIAIPVWMVLWWKGSFRCAPALTTAVSPLIASLLFGFTLVSALQLELALLDSMNVTTVSVFAGGTAFALVSLYALYRVIRMWNAGIHPLAKWHALFVALACVTVSGYLVYWRLVPLRLWAW